MGYSKDKYVTSPLTGKLTTPYVAEKHRRSIYAKNHPRKYLGYRDKVKIIERQHEVCNMCGRQIQVHYKSTKWVDMITGEINYCRGLHNFQENEALIYIIKYYSFCDIQFHHVIPISQGGADEINNIEAVCYDCHLKLHGKKGM